MRAPNAAELLIAWEIGLRQPPNQRALSLLAAACPESTDEELWTLSIGQRDARLLEMRRRLFGSNLSIVTACPACGDPLESSVRLEDIRRSESPPANAVHVCDVDGFRVTFRLPTSRDLISVVADESQPARGDALLKRCITGVRNADGEVIDASVLPGRANASVVEQMAVLDAQADVQLQMACPACAHRWSAAFDIAGFLWKEVHAWAQRTLRDVHRLARAYGWPESQTLALSPTRRQIYLELSRE